MKGKESRKEIKKEKSDKPSTKELSDYQREKKSKSEKGIGITPKA